jgi:hypothetical protein
VGHCSRTCGTRAICIECAAGAPRAARRRPEHLKSLVFFVRCFQKQVPGAPRLTSSWDAPAKGTANAGRSLSLLTTGSTGSPTFLLPRKGKRPLLCAPPLIDVAGVRQVGKVGGVLKPPPMGNASASPTRSTRNMAGGNRPAIAGVALPDLQSRRGEGQWFGSLVFNLGMRGAPIGTERS